MYEDDAENFLKLATVLKVILTRSARERDPLATQELLCDYLRVYAKVSLFLASWLMPSRTRSLSESP